MNTPDSPLTVYMRHTAHANHIILKEIANDIYSKCNGNKKED